MTEATYANIASLKEDVQEAESDYLRAHGWQQTSLTPGSYWMWRRSFEDVNARRLAEHKAFCDRIGQDRTHHPYPSEMLVDTDTAIRMTWAEIDPRRRELEDESD